MLYTPSHAELAQHPKTRKLARHLGVSIPTAIGHLHLLWHFALKYAPDGDLARFDWDEIEDGVMWEGIADGFCTACIAVGWLDCNSPDNDEDHSLSIHDWQEYGGKYVNRKEANAQRMREARAKQQPSTETPRATHVQRTCVARVEPEERRGEESKEEEKENVLPPAAIGVATAPRNTPTPPTPIVRPAPKPKDEAPKERPRDLLFDAVCETCGIDHTMLTDTERGRVNAAVGQIRKAGAAPDDVPIHGGNYRLHFTTPLTPMALAGNWSMTAKPPDPPPEQRVRATHTGRGGFNSDDAFSSNVARIARMRQEANR